MRAIKSLPIRISENENDNELVSTVHECDASTLFGAIHKALPLIVTTQD